MVIVYCKSTWVKIFFFYTQVEKHMQILAMFRDGATVKSNISVNFNLQKSTIMRKFRSQTDRLNVTANKNSYIYFRKIFNT